MTTRRDRAAVAVADAIWPGIELDEPEAREAYRIADLVLAEIDRIPDVSELIEASSLGTPEAKAARASVSDEQAQRAIDIANRIRRGARVGRGAWAVDIADRINRFGTRPDPDSPDDFLCAFRFRDGELCERAAGHSGTHTPHGMPRTDGGAGAPPARAGAATSPAPQGEATVPPASPSPLTGGRTATPPADQTSTGVPAPGSGTAAESATAAPTAESVLPSVTPRTFLLFRTRDITGKSGTGIVAWGVLWPDQTVALRWTTKHRSTVHWDGLDAVLDVHGHSGATVLHWLDGA